MGFIPEITTRVSVETDTSELQETIKVIESNPILSQLGLIEEIESVESKLKSLEKPLALGVSGLLQRNQEIIIATKHYIKGLMANSVDITEDGDDYLVGNTAMSVDGFPYPLVIEKGRRGGYEVKPITYSALHWIDKDTGEDVFAKVSHPGPVAPDPFVEPSIEDTMRDIDDIINKQFGGL